MLPSHMEFQACSAFIAPSLLSTWHRRKENGQKQCCEPFQRGILPEVKYRSTKLQRLRRFKHNEKEFSLPLCRTFLVYLGTEFESPSVFGMV